MSDGQHGHHHSDRGDHGGGGDGPIPATFASENLNEWGSQLKVQPLQGAASAIATGSPQRLVNLTGKVRGTRMMTVAVYALPIVDLTDSNIRVPGGPLVGILDFSGGGGGGTIEFDVPCNTAGGGTSPAMVAAGGTSLSGVSPGGGAIVSVPGSAIQLSVRNDAALVPNAGIANAVQLGFTSADNRLWPFVKAVAGYGSKTGRLTRSAWAFNFNPGQGGAGFGSDLTSVVWVPPYARSFRVLRNQSNNADTIGVNLFGLTATGGGILEKFALVGGAPSPSFTLGPATAVQLVFGAGNAGTIASCVVVFNIENGAEP